MSNMFKFEPFCGLHYTSEQDIIDKGGNFESIEDKSFILNTYINYFTNLCISMFKVQGLPNNIDADFVIRTLIRRGSIAFFKAKEKDNIKDTKSLLLNAQPFVTTKRFNEYGKPTAIQLRNGINCATTYNGLTLNNSDDFEIIKLTPQANSLYPTIYYFCNKIVEVQRAIDVNVFNNQTPLVVEATPEQSATFTEALKSWGRQLKHIVLNKKAGARPEDLFSSKDIGVEWKADKMTDVMQYYKAEFYTMLGINHTPYEKRANMVRDEVRSNSHILRLTVDSMLDSLNYGAKLVNEKFGTKIVFTYTLDSIYDTDIISDADSKHNAGVITEEEATQEKLEEAQLKSMIADGSIIDDYMFSKNKSGYTIGQTQIKDTGKGGV